MINCLLTELGRTGREILGVRSRRMDLAEYILYYFVLYEADWSKCFLKCNIFELTVPEFLELPT